MLGINSWPTFKSKEEGWDAQTINECISKSLLYNQEK